jgi:hypothetical protein
MSIQSQSQIASNRFVVTLQALVPASNTNAVSVGQAYDLADATLTTNAVSGGVTIPGGSYPVA